MEEIKEILHSRDPKVKSIEDAERIDEKSNPLDNAHIIPLKSQISSLKCAAVQSQTVLWFCERLSDDNKENRLADDEHEEAERMYRKKKESDNVKNKISAVQENLKKLAESIQASFERNKKKRLLIENKLSIIEEKEKKYNKILSRKQSLEEQKQAYFDNSGEKMVEDCFQEKVRQTQETMVQCAAAIETLKEHKSLLEAELNSLWEASEKLEEKLLSLKTNEEKSFKYNQEQERTRSLTNLVTSLSGLKIVNVTNNCLTVEIQDIQGEEPPEERATILVTLTFAEVDGQIIVQDVETNSLTFFIKDMIEQAKSTSHLIDFLLEVQKRFQNQAKLLKEMKVLQERYAIDWNDEKQTVRVMLGKAGQMVCTLKIHNGYPMSGHVSVEEIPGADWNLLFQDSMTINELKSLTSWIEYLMVRYGSL